MHGEWGVGMIPRCTIQQKCQTHIGLVKISTTSQGMHEFPYMV